MITMGVFYKPPEDAEAFEKRYVEGHLPLVRAYENIQKASAYKVTRTLMGEFPYAYVFSGIWVDKEGWRADMSSELAKQATEDAKEFAPPFDVIVMEELA